MAKIPSDVAWVGELIPNLVEQSEQFVVDTDELDDELIEVFVEEILRLTNDLQEGLTHQDLGLIREAAHSIKGMGGTIGLPEISVLALETEHAAKAEDMARCSELIHGLVAWVARFD